ncbi:MAG: hypothetical protein PHX62_00100 [Bacilli bacterium]|nr:hypothetical protein [Bacilli bacterium]
MTAVIDGLNKNAIVNDCSLLICKNIIEDVFPIALIDDNVIYIET